MLPRNREHLLLISFRKLSPEEQAAYVAKLQSENSELKSAVKEASKELPTFTVEKGGENFEAGEYQFQYPTFTWDDNTIINVHELMADAEGEDEKVAQKSFRNYLFAGSPSIRHR